MLQQSGGNLCMFIQCALYNGHIQAFRPSLDSRLIDRVSSYDVQQMVYQTNIISILASQLIGWLAGWLTDWLAAWLVDWLIGWMVCWFAVWLAG